MSVFQMLLEILCKRSPKMFVVITFYPDAFLVFCDLKAAAISNRRTAGSRSKVSQLGLNKGGVSLSLQYDHHLSAAYIYSYQKRVGNIFK